MLSFSKTAGEADADCFDDDDDGDMSVSQVPHVSRVDYIEKGKSAFVLFSGVDQALHTKKKKKRKEKKMAEKLRKGAVRSYLISRCTRLASDLLTTTRL